MFFCIFEMYIEHFEKNDPDSSFIFEIADCKRHG